MTSPYTARLLEHYRHPRNFGSLEHADAAHELLNPVCGDRIRIELRLHEVRIADVRFRGDACAICIAAASLLTELLRGMNSTEAMQLEDERLLAELEAPIPEARRRCALLPLEALHAALAEYQEGVGSDRSFAPQGMAGGARPLAVADRVSAAAWRDADRPRIAAVVLAAGASRRFGDNKLLAPVVAAPLVRHTVATVLAEGIREVVVVLGRDAELVERALAGLHVRCVTNPRFAEGMSTSLRSGIDALAPETAAAVIVLADQLLPQQVIARLVEEHATSGKPIVVPLYSGERGNPVLFDASVFPELRAVTGDRGARDVIARDPERVATVTFPFAPPPDVDTPEDYERLLAERRGGA